VYFADRRHSSLRLEQICSLEPTFHENTYDLGVAHPPLEEGNILCMILIVQLSHREVGVSRLHWFDLYVVLGLVC
jgi:hypothetical protein